jgi:hypothetical protein
MSLLHLSELVSHVWQILFILVNKKNENYKIIPKISPYNLDQVSNSVPVFFFVCVCYIKNKIQQSVD